VNIYLAKRHLQNSSNPLLMVTNIIIFKCLKFLPPTIIHLIFILIDFNR